MKKFVFAMLGLSLFITACSEKKEEKINNSVVVSQGSKPKSWIQICIMRFLLLRLLSKYLILY